MMATDRGPSIPEPADEILEPASGEPAAALASRPPEDPEATRPAP